MPKAESFVQTPDGPGKRQERGPAAETVRVSLDSAPEPLKTYHGSEIIVLRNGKGQPGGHRRPGAARPLCGGRGKRRRRWMRPSSPRPSIWMPAWRRRRSGRRSALPGSGEGKSAAGTGAVGAAPAEPSRQRADSPRARPDAGAEGRQAAPAQAGEQARPAQAGGGPPRGGCADCRGGRGQAPPQPTTGADAAEQGRRRGRQRPQERVKPDRRPHRGRRFFERTEKKRRTPWKI